jgi:CHASE3 domain sensor protein
MSPCATGMVLIILSIAASYFTINSLISGAQSETEARETVLLLEQAVSEFKAAESSQRRYLLTNTARTSPPTSKPAR